MIGENMNKDMTVLFENSDYTVLTWDKYDGAKYVLMGLNDCFNYEKIVETNNNGAKIFKNLFKKYINIKVYYTLHSKERDEDIVIGSSNPYVPKKVNYNKLDLKFLKSFNGITLSIQSKDIYDKYITYENILDVWNTVRKTCKNKREVFKFSLNLQSNIMNVYNSLKNKTYVPSKYHTFMIFEPKPRLVMSQCVFDKVVNHFVAKYYLLPYLENSLMDLNVATRCGKGSAGAMKIMRKNLNEILMWKHPKEIFCLKIDISKYFYTIDHNILMSKLERHILDKDVLDTIKKILDETNKDYINHSILHYNKRYNTDIPLYLNNKGLSIGAMTSQFLAIFYLNDLDHFIVEKLKTVIFIC